jgi:hypothetical protein
MNDQYQCDIVFSKELGILQENINNILFHSML